jgi:hypothetical protein
MAKKDYHKPWKTSAPWAATRRELRQRPGEIFRARERVKEGLHRVLSEAPLALMGPGLVELAHPEVEVGLQALDHLVELLAEGDAIELIEHGFVEALDDAVIRYEIGGASFSGCSWKGADDMVSPSGTRGAGSTKVRAGRR